MVGFGRLVFALASAVLLLTIASECAAAGERSPPLLGRCFEMHRLWSRYETANCPNQTGQRAQAEWALYRCLQGDFDRGLGELERLLRRDLICIPGRAHSCHPRRQDAVKSSGR
jgi:hypothetical protein